MPILRVKPGIAIAQDGTYPEWRGNRKGGGGTFDLSARFEEATYRGNVYIGGMQLTSISNATFTTADGLSGTLATAATATPIAGVWNPSGSNVLLSILQAIVSTVLTALQATGPGPYVWAAFNGQSAALTTGLVPANRKSFLASGSQAKNLAGVALTGLQNTGLFLGASALGVPLHQLSFLQTAAGALTPGQASVENIDGSIIVPPGGILALFASGTPVAVSAASALLWEEIPL